MAATVKRNIWLYSSAGNVAPERVRGRMAASQGLLIPGSPLYLSQDGTFKAADTADGTGDLITHMLATYLTAEAAVNDVVYAVRVTVGQLWAVYVESGGADSAAATAIDVEKSMLCSYYMPVRPMAVFIIEIDLA